MQHINKQNKFTFIKNFFSISLLMMLNLLGFTQYSSAQTFVFDGTNIGTTLTEGIIETNNTAINQTSFGKTQVYFGGDTPDKTENGGHVASSILTNQNYDLTAIGALKISGTFYNRNTELGYNESYVGIVPNGTTKLANPMHGYPVDDREGINLIGNNTYTLPTAKWFSMSATIAIQGTDLVLLEKNIDGNISGPTVIGPVSDYPYLNDLRAFIAVDDHASQMDVEILSSNLVTTVSASSSTASVGDTVSYTITVTNRGSKDETNISLTDYIPGSLEHPVGNVSQGTFSNDGTWIVGNLANGESATLNLTGTVSDGVQGGVITNRTTAASTPDLADPTTDGDILTADISIDPIASLQGTCSGAFDWDNSGWEFGQKVGTITLMDGLTADINVSSTSAGTFSMNTLDNTLDTPFVDLKNYYFGGVSDLGIIFEPDANTGTSPVTIKLTFSEPVHNGSFLISDIDTSTNGTSDRDDRVTVTSDLGTPTLQVVHSSAPLVSVSSNVATTTYNDENGSDNDTRGTVRVVIPDGATSVTLTYEEVDTTVEDHGARGIGAFGNLAACKVETDTDGDGVLDKDDLDDDNDGVLDVNETNPLQFVNFNFSDTLNNWVTSSSEDVGFVHYENNGDGRTAVDENFRTASLSQLISSETCANPGVKSFSFDLKWNNGADNTKPDEETESILDVSFGGVQYLSVRTPRDGTSNVDDASDQGGDALLTPMNGATVVLSSPSDQGALYLDHAKWEDIVYSKVTITLPNEISNAEILFYMNVKVDDYHLDNIQLEDAYCGIDTDGDGILNHLDLDVDNDGIPDNVEAQTTAGYIPTSGTVDAEGTYSAIYGANGLTPVDTDEDNVTDMLDTDSDNDGSLDKDESGLTLSGNVGVNGLDNDVDTIDDYSDVNGKINTPSDDLKEADNNSEDVDYRSLAAQNNPPVAVDSNHTIATGSTQVLDLESLITDSDAGATLSVQSINDVNLTGGVQVITVPNGEIRIDANDIVTFVPNAGFTGTTSFDYVGTDGTDTVVASVNITVTKDTDGDGVIDSIDLDDDNDGVLDVNERCDFPYQETIVDGSWVGVSDSTYSVTKTTGFVADEIDYHKVASLNKGEIIVEHNGFYNAAGTMDITYNFSPAIPANDLFFGFSDVDSATANYSGDFTITFDGGASMSDFDIVSLEDYPLLKVNNNVLSTSGIDDEAAYFIGRTSKLVSSVTIKSSTIPSGDNIAFFIGGTSAPCDKDGDGIPNYLDLDSDNDGIPDNVEAQTTSGYKATTGNVDANGTWSAVYGANGLIPVDTDEDNITDTLDTDSDNDGSLDKDESGLTLTNTDANKDGIDDGVHASYADVNGDVNTPSSDLKEADNNSADVDYRSLAAQNNPPVAVDSNHTIATGSTQVLDLESLITDSDAGATLSVVSINDVNLTGGVQVITVPNGEIRIDANDIVTFVPNVGFTGTTSFDYVGTDGTDTVVASVNITVTKDTDGDGVIDSIDLDDDNDGVLDSNENECRINFNVCSPDSGSSCTIANGLENMTMSSVGSILKTYSSAGSPGIYPDGSDELSNDLTYNFSPNLLNSVIRINDLDGKELLQINAYDAGGNRIIDLTPYITDIVQSSNSWTTVASSNYGAEINVSTDIEESSLKNHMIFTLPFEVSKIVIKSTARSGTATAGYFILSGCAVIDTDGDAIPNYLDLDSDNDGIPDNVEAQTTSGYKATTGNVDANGTWSAVYGANGLTPVDTDEDNVTDILDTDSDNDGTEDKVESGLTLTNADANNDGIDDGVHASYADVNGDVNTPSSDLKEADNNSVDVDYRSLAAQNNPSVTVEDNATGTTGNPVEVDVLANDTDAEDDIDPTTVKIIDANGNPVTTLTVPNEGTWTVNATTGAITFTPLASFTGDPTPITYVVSDKTGNESAPATVNVDYPQTGTTSKEDNATGTTGNPVEVDVLANDTDAEDDIDPTTVKIIDANGNPVTTLTVPNEGTWSVNPTTGAITFIPETGFTGDPTPITYVVSDKTGNESAPATVNVDYPQTGTDSSEDNATAETGKAVTIDVLANDTDAEDDIDPTTVKIIDANGNKVTTLTVPNEGTWTVNVTTGAITFTPLASFTGDPTPITYVVSDKTGNESAPATVNVDYPEVKLDSDNDGIPDSIDLDDDNDGIPDTVEEHGTPNLDTDGDGVPDRLDLDSDNDGILDLLESGQDVATVDPDGNGVLDSEVDADKDGLMDTADSDDNDDNDKTSTGKVTPIDTDGDHKPDFQDVDSDNDSLSDMVESGIPADKDTDNDGMIDDPEVDKKNGVPTVVASVKVPVNTDGDTVPNYRDLDSDNDGLNDVAEVDGLDENKDGIVDTEGSLVDGTSIPDTDGDNTPDVLEPNNPNLPKTLDTNNDGVIDKDKNHDNDNDGIPNVTDANNNLFGTGILIDSDGDTIPDNIDIDDDNDGIPDVVENRGNPSRDTDGDGVIDSLDLDADNDGILDIVEAGGVDTNNDGRVDLSTSSGQVTDTDKDGLADVVDAAPAVANNPADESAGKAATLLLVPNTDGDTNPDFQDVDSDNDGLSDLMEAGITVDNDENNDGMIDNPAVNANGIATVVTAVAHPLDSDNDKIPDYRELDSDNDGEKDIVEAGGTDTNHDGLVDDEDTLIDVSNLPDVDRNGIPDYRELNCGVEPKPTPEPVEPEPTPTPVPTATPATPEIKPDTQTVDLSEPVNVNVLANDEGELDSSSVQIELPDGFMDTHPDAVRSEDGKRLTVPGEGTWTVNSDGTITYEVEEGATVVNPTPISYSVENTDGKRLETDATIVLSQSAVNGGTDTVENCDCVSVEDNVSIYESWNLVLVIILGSIFGLFFFRREKN